MAKKPLEDDQRNNYFFVDSRRLVLDENFIERELYEDIDQIVHWIEVNGIRNLNPLKCFKRGEQWVVRRGSRRLRAIRILETKVRNVIMVPIMVIQKGDSEERQYFEQATENDTAQYTPWEKAKVLRRARNVNGWSEEKMAEESGWSMVYVKRLLSLVDSPERLTQLVRKGKVSATLAMDTIQEAKAKEDPKILEDLIEKGQQSKAVSAEQELFPTAANPPKTQKITKGDIRPSPWKIFKKWSPTVQEEKLPPVKLEAWNLIIKIRDGEATEEDFKNFFG